MDSRSKAAGCLCLILAFLGIALALQAQDTADINNIYVPVVNNTDLYPAQRVQGVTYWANETPIDIYLIFHAIGTGAGQSFDSNLSINGTVLQDDDFHTSAGAGFHDHWPLSARIPKGANYSVTNSTNVFNIEWREYPILSGKNGTLSINQTVLSNGSEIAALQANDTYFNGSIFNQSKSFRNDSINDTLIRNYTAHIRIADFTRDTSIASGTQTIIGVGFKPSAVDFYLVHPGSKEMSIGIDDGTTASSTIFTYNSLSAFSFQTQYSLYYDLNDGVTMYRGRITSFTDDGFVITWTKTGSPTAVLNIGYKAYR